MSGTLTTIERKPWAKLPSESAKAYRAFEIFLELPVPRVAERAWEIYKDERRLTGARPAPQWRKWKSQNDWEWRALQFDEAELAATEPELASAIDAARQKVIEALPDLIQVAIDAAKGGDTKMLCDLFDRIGFLKQKTKTSSATINAIGPSQFNFDLGSADAEQLIYIANLLKN